MKFIVVKMLCNLRSKMNNVCIFWEKSELISNGSRRLKTNTTDRCQKNYAKTCQNLAREQSVLLMENPAQN